MRNPSGGPVVAHRELVALIVAGSTLLTAAIAFGGGSQGAFPGAGGGSPRMRAISLPADAIRRAAPAWSRSGWVLSANCPAGVIEVLSARCQVDRVRIGQADCRALAPHPGLRVEIRGQGLLPAPGREWNGVSVSRARDQFLEGRIIEENCVDHTVLLEICEGRLRARVWFLSERECSGNYRLRHGQRVRIHGTVDYSAGRGENAIWLHTVTAVEHLD